MAEQTTGIMLTVGDYVRLKSRAANQHQSFQLNREELSTQYESVDGIVLSIREISTGRLLAETSGDLDGYVIELLNERTFSSRFASQRNAPRGTDHPTAAPAWARLRQALRQAADGGVLYSSSMPTLFTESPLAKLLDGWKVLRIRSCDFEPVVRRGQDDEEE
ncbi:MAG: hypothetical protein BWY76_03124 [bacterium ADurb.Bin429]|nr:MAG: hypothetical protein BWY76_03124 [bacterium ADurb.Bin429]